MFEYNVLDPENSAQRYWVSNFLTTHYLRRRKVTASALFSREGLCINH